MAHAEINALIENASEHPGDFEGVLAAIGAYQRRTEQIDFRIQQTTQIASDETADIKTLRLVRDIRDGSGDDPDALAIEMREGVESYFPAEYRARFSGYFTKIAMPEMPPIEK